MYPLANHLCSPIPKGPILQCYIQRKIEGDGASKMFPIYELCTKDDRFLLVGVKRCDLTCCVSRMHFYAHLSNIVSL